MIHTFPERKKEEEEEGEEEVHEEISRNNIPKHMTRRVSIDSESGPSDERGRSLARTKRFCRQLSEDDEKKSTKKPM